MTVEKECFRLLKETRVGSHERIVRALFPPHWDASLKRATSSAFKGNCISTNRRSLASFDEIVKINRKDLEKPDRLIEAYAEVDVQTIQLISAKNSNNTKATPVLLEVIEDPIPPDNLSHAQIVAQTPCGTTLGNISKGVSNSILKECTILEKLPEKV